MGPRLQRCWLWLVAPMLCCAHAAERPWRMATTPQYTLLSQASERETREWMRGFDQFILSTADLLRFDLKALPPLTVLLFNGDKDYTPYKLRRPDGKTASVAGQFVRRPTWSLIGMSLAAEDDELRQTIFHEATHWLMSMDQARHPAWFSEGIAEMFSTFERRGDKVNWSKPLGSHLAILQERTIPLSQFLVEPTALSNRDDRQMLFYAQAWAFTDFLMFSDNSQRRPLMLKFLEKFRSESGEATVKDVFGDQLPQIERDFHLFISQHSFPYVIQPVKPAPPAAALQPAPAVLVEASLGLLALAAERPELAREHASRAIALDAGSPKGYELQAYMALESEDPAQAAKQAELALLRGSRDSQLFVLMGDSYTQAPNSQRPDAERARVGMYENAINLNPKRLEVYQRLAAALMPIDKPTEADLQFLDVGLRAFPGEDWLRVATALVEYRLGRRDSGVATLEKVLRPESTLDTSEREYALNLRRSWWVEDMNQELRDAASRRDTAAARAAIGKYRDRLGDIPEIAKYLEELEASLKQPEQPPSSRNRK